MFSFGIHCDERVFFMLRCIILFKPEDNEKGKNLFLYATEINEENKPVYLFHVVCNSVLHFDDIVKVVRNILDAVAL